jgi:molybdate transport system substrate-binding protein
MKCISFFIGALALALGGCAMTDQAAVAATPLSVYSAGSLREALTAIAADYEARSGQKIALTFGASGLLRQRIEQGEGAQVFASADTDHPQRLAKRGGWLTPQVFTRNSLCALTAANVSVSPDTLLATLLRTDVRVGTSAPKADPAGDYAWALFRRAEAVRAGSYAVLDAKALQLTGGADSPKPPAGRGTYAWVMEQGQADVFLTYCTNAVAAQQEVPRLKIAAVPPELQVGAAYGLTQRSDAPPAARAFVAYVLSEPGQAVLQRYGFARP